MSVHRTNNERLEQCRVYRVIYSVQGRGGKLLNRIQACVVAMDVGDVADQIRGTILGAELTITDPDGKLEFHEVAEAVEIESAELVGRLHGVTDRAYGIITKCDDQEKKEEPANDD